ncbi:uncharacterized protein K460DRAFT_373415 [Cucurbitaria berberidis CBS 394.84]|uniref:Uncharacterized protein n=1 Tax=Cucurbitaria berberidis CBS 394.84 TaxID=1168544 RepID=A0A9P4GU63_9PLEO|nr:uncharacterized protein K460DRAFT_373415 [Cucurbitaria berberidis CBS 394.84]KAF1851397.1 hypothetical protein K460DRAFT_373415 [Cucurbitaria berberidis CBS 394.84]
MASESSAPGRDRPAASSRKHTGLENLLPASITTRSRSKPRTRPSATPHLERSLSSMTDSFMLEHWGASTHTPPTELDSAATSQSKVEDALTPISNWAHLNYIKNQRNSLRGELKAHLIAGAEAKRSVTSLRRLAFRMAVNISVKEKQIATTARNLANSRKSNYLEGKDTQTRIEDLKRALRVEEGRNQEILEALERASMLTLQYSTPQSQAQHRLQRNPFSPPPSPPTRLSNPPESPLGSPRTPIRANSSPWHDMEWGLTPNIETPADIRTSDNQALAACRSRIEELQAECAQMEETLTSTRLQQELQAKTKELAHLEQMSGTKQQLIGTLQREKTAIEDQLHARNLQFGELENRAATLKENLHALQNKLETAERHESSLRDRIAEKESARTQYMELLQQKIAGYESQATQQLKQIEVGGGVISELHTEDASATLRTEMELLSATLRAGNDERDELVSIEEDLYVTRERLEQETVAHTSNLQAAQEHAKLETLRDAKAALEADLRDARQTLFRLREELRANNSKLSDKLHSSEERVSFLETELDRAVKSKDERSNAQLRELESSVLDLQTDLHRVQTTKDGVEEQLGEVLQSKKHLQSEFNNVQSRLSKTKADLEERLNTTIHDRDMLKKVTRLEEALALVQMEGEASGVEISSLHEQLNEVHTKKGEGQLDSAQARLAQLSTLQDETTRIRHSKEEAGARLTTAQASYDDLNKQHKAEAAEIGSRLSETEEELTAIRLKSNTELEIQLDDALSSNVGLGIRLDSTRAELSTLEANNEGLNSSDDVERRLDIALSSNAELSEDIDKLSNTEQDLDILRKDKADIDERLGQALARTEKEFEAQNAWQASTLSTTNEELATRLDGAEKHSEALESELSSMSSQLNKLKSEEKRLDIVESEGLTLNSKSLEADKEITSLRDTNARLEASEKDLQFRLSSAEEDLDTVRETNARLESFLDQLETDMATAEVAVEESAKRLEEFVEESQAKIDASRNAKLKYKHRVSERNHEIEVLRSENSELQHQIGEQTQELGTLGKGKAKLVEELSAKKKYIQELELSSDKRMRSMNSTYNELRKKHEEQGRQQRLSPDHDSAGRLKAKLQARDAEIEEMRKSKEQFASSFATLEQEVRALRDDKKAFKKLVAALQDKIRHLQVLEEWEEPITLQESYDTAPQSPMSGHTTSSRLTPIGFPSVQHERPTTRSSAVSHDDDLDAWAREVERVRMLRNETAIQLSGMKKARHDLKKSLKDSEAHLHQLEKQAKPKHHRALLRKSRPSTPARVATEPGQISPLPRTPTRPATSGGFPHTPESTASTRYSTILSSPSTPHWETKRWSTLPRPKTSHRPFTGRSGKSLFGEGPTSAGEEEIPVVRPKEKRRWSSGLRSLFKGEH